MIKVVKRGIYELAETRQQIKILCLDGSAYLWLSIPGLGHVLEASDKHQTADYLLASGCYRVYEVENESDFSNQKHLELCMGDGRWQGYLLADELQARKKRTKLLPTREVISLSSDLRFRPSATN